MNNMNEVKQFTKDDFTEDELRTLRAMFNAAWAVTRAIEIGLDGVYGSNTLYEIEQKLGLSELLSDTW